ncbi:acyltransferase family protein [Blastococcus sp. PRF04-17]|uniref:acyltransferase family protein n=1 Tax=Blastococcus sp. PRF04-17 TaxID=2933797 RepID=UPI001FF2E73C|nr:acyltransferase [Blastococcus sp. PRF04-17]UOY02197.1 acyltransferase [Blastococcus sp. PRF04-17]
MTASVAPDGGAVGRTEHEFPGLDGVRVLAATAVVLTHAAFWTTAGGSTVADRALARLDVGVAVFFVLSGFLLGRPFVRAAASGRPRPRAAGYLWRRGLRILPAYWVAVVAALLLLPGNEEATVGDWVRHLLLVQIYDGRPDAVGLTHLWSMCTEVSFYLLLPWLAAGLLRLAGRTWRPDRLLAALVVLALAGWVWVAGIWLLDLDGVTPHLWLPTHLAWFAGGMALAVLSLGDPDRTTARVARDVASSFWTCWALAAAAFWLACSPVAGPLGLEDPTPAQAVAKSMLYLAVGVLLVAPLVLGRRPLGAVGSVLGGRPARVLAELSYGLFLFHMPVLVGLYHLLGWPPFSGPFWFVAIVTWLGGTAVAGACYLLLEKPVRRWRSLVPAQAPEPARRAGPADDAGAQTESTTPANAVSTSS